ncbi:MAG: MBL fold metallo-hydrolase [Thermicanus sp.]|nr:MBL fold metallo-hydrolase [Thermicanus sp.]
MKRFQGGPLGTNGYLLYNEGKKGLYIDPGAPSPKIKEWIEGMGIYLQGILLTHAHFDHIGGLDWMREWSKAPVYQHVLEAKWLSRPELNGSGYSMFSGWVPPIRLNPADVLIDREGDWIIGDFSIHVLHTPGHSPGSLTFVAEDKAFCGDVLFRLGIGRTDFPGGDYATLMHSIQDKLMELPGETFLYPGHGESTRIEREQEENPYLTGFMGV